MKTDFNLFYYLEKETKRKSTGTPKSAKKPAKSSHAKTKTPSSTPKKQGGATPISTPKKSESAGATPIKDSPTKKGRKKKEEEREVWKWWEEEPHPEGVKWLTLEHNVGVVTTIFGIEVYFYRVHTLLLLMNVCRVMFVFIMTV